MSQPSAASQPEPLDVLPQPAPEPVAAPVPAGNSRGNQFKKVDDPKNVQFTGRATESEAAKIKAIMAANGCTDIVRLVLKCIKAAENDIFSPIKTK